VKRLLLFVCLVGAAVYMLTPPRPVLEADRVSVAQAQGDRPGSGPLRSSWGSTLRSLRQEPQGNSQEAASPRQHAEYGPKALKAKRDPQPMLAADDRTASVDRASAPETDTPKRQAAEWARITLSARAHSEASLSSPTVRVHPPGTELQILGHTNGWFQLLDPKTQEVGWVFYKYLHSIDRPSRSQPTVEARAEPPPVATPNVAVKATTPTTQKSQEPDQSAKRAIRAAVRSSDEVTKPDRRGGLFARRGERRRGVGLFGFRGRKAARRAWTIGPAR
jgi:hypothetical protein